MIALLALPLGAAFTLIWWSGWHYGKVAGRKEMREMMRPTYTAKDLFPKDWNPF